MRTVPYPDSSSFSRPGEINSTPKTSDQDSIARLLSLSSGDSESVNLADVTSGCCGGALAAAASNDPNVSSAGGDGRVGRDSHRWSMSRSDNQSSGLQAMKSGQSEGQRQSRVEELARQSSLAVGRADLYFVALFLFFFVSFYCEKRLCPLQTLVGIPFYRLFSRHPPIYESRCFLQKSSRGDRFRPAGHEDFRSFLFTIFGPLACGSTTSKSSFQKFEREFCSEPPPFLRPC